MPDGWDDDYTYCQIAYHEGIARIRKVGLDKDGNINFSKVLKADRALAYCLQGLYRSDEEAAFLRRGIFSQVMALGCGSEFYEGINDNLTFAYFVEIIDEHRGGPE